MNPQQFHHKQLNLSSIWYTDICRVQLMGFNCDIWHAVITCRVMWWQSYAIIK